MLAKEDINQIVEAHKQVFFTREEIDERFAEIRANFSQLQTSVDAIAKQGKDTNEEHIILRHRVELLESKN